MATRIGVRLTILSLEKSHDDVIGAKEIYHSIRFVAYLEGAIGSLVFLSLTHDFLRLYGFENKLINSSLIDIYSMVTITKDNKTEKLRYLLK